MEFGLSQLENYTKLGVKSFWMNNLYVRLRVAIETGDKPLVKKLLSKKPDFVYLKDEFGATVLHSVALINDLEIAKIILARKHIQVNAQDEEGLTPLHLVVNPVIAQLMIDYGAAVDVEDHQGNTPLHAHAAQELPDVIEVLLKNRADDTKANHSGKTPLEISKSKNDVTSIRTFEEYTGAQLSHCKNHEEVNKKNQPQYLRALRKTKECYGFHERKHRKHKNEKLKSVALFIWIMFNVCLWIYLLCYYDEIQWRILQIDPKDYIIFRSGDQYSDFVLAAIIGGFILAILANGHPELERIKPKRLIGLLGLFLAYLGMGFAIFFYANDFIGIRQDRIDVGLIAPNQVKHYAWKQVDEVYVHFYYRETRKSHTGPTLIYTFKFTNGEDFNLNGPESYLDEFEQVNQLINTHQIVIEVEPGQKEAYQMVLDGKKVTKHDIGL